MLTFVSIICVFSFLTLLQTRSSIQTSSASILSRLYSQKLSVIDGHFGNSYTNLTNENSTVIYKFEYKEIENKTTAVRISIKLLNTADEDFPLLFVARQQRGVISWQLPLPLENIYEYEYASRTLCPLDQQHRKADMKQVMYAEISSMSVKNLTFSLKASKVSDFELKPGEVKNLSLTPSEPQYYMYTFPRNIDSVIVKVESGDRKCMVLSVQDIQCPVFDLDKDVEFSGTYQTVTKQGAITVEKKKYTEESFYIVLVMKPKDYECNGIDEIQLPGEERTKHLTLRVYGTISSSKYYIGIVGALAIFGAFYLIAFMIGICYHGCQKNRGVWIIEEEKSETEGETEDLLNRANTLPGSYGATSGNERDVMDRSLHEIQTPHNTTVDTDSVDSSIDFLPDADKEKDVFRTKTILFVVDLSRKSRKRVAKSYSLFCRNLAAISIFYGLAVLQLVLTYQKVLNVTGNQDICYYNFDCAHPLGALTSFNNVFSNIGYILLGILFLFLVARRDVIYKKAVQNDRKIGKELGIPQHFGLFYAMGLALIMEGLMSACYHVCPNYSNFQFDTSFMYIIACLCMLKIYQSRHPDISAKAHTSYMFMACVIFIAVIGVLHGTEVFWIVFSAIYMVGTLIMSVYIYYMGRWKLNREIFIHTWIQIRQNCFMCPRPMYKDRFLFLVLGNSINWSIAIFGAVKRPGDFASYLLAIFIGNLMFYTVYYTIMKLRHKERLHPLAIFFVVCAILCWIPALYFFFAHLTSWRLNPSQSREGNQNCMLFEFYDAHDIWHFLSAISMFFSFLILLTLDDDLFSTRRDKIPVF
ncbi:SID1 transmembrane family member 1,SID1 transmembrane family member 2 [Mytilus coruscus]|uniref:SID1 transmembrane family member 1,SID1 transmembrane family member 2 n=1 Tax=Mytilus coruscus TaxID=42192 RepID=A0A6J8CY32_MYTCO|nr:SID1 transmembrane family member 1,SID1 transmembrane family member 2 [Mytilus coruscus]